MPSGILTGLIVALAAEIRQYWLNKRNTQNLLYNTARELYGLISNKRAGLKYYINNGDKNIPRNIGDDDIIEMILLRIKYLKNVDYAVFWNSWYKGDITDALQMFNEQLYTMEGTVTHLLEIKIECIKMEMILLEYNKESREIIESSRIMKVLNEKYLELEKSLEDIEAFCNVFEKVDSLRFMWSRDKSRMIEMAENIAKNIYYNPMK